MSLTPAFQFNLNNNIEKGVVAIGKWDGKHTSLCCGTSAGKILIHNPYERQIKDDENNELRFLNINRKITAIDAGPLHPNLEYDLLLVGTQTNLLCYDVEKNSDIFYKDVADGAHALLYGRPGGAPAPLAVVGGNCSIQGFDHEGAEAFWTVTGDLVSAFALADVQGEGHGPNLICGSEDYEIRVFKQEEVVAEITEAEAAECLCPIPGPGGGEGSPAAGGGGGGGNGRFAYGLRNGTVGVYAKTSRVWRVKSKHKVAAVQAFDIDADGAPELISGWGNGSLNARRTHNGEVVHKAALRQPVAALLRGNYRLDGQEELIVCCTNGEVRGYVPTEEQQAAAEVAEAADARALGALQQTKADLMLELRGLEDSIKQRKSGLRSAAAIPLDTRVELEIKSNQERRSCELHFWTTNDAVIMNMVVLDLEGGLFEGESLVTTPRPPGQHVHMHLRPKKNVAAKLKIQCQVGARAASDQLHVFELEYELPKFALFCRVADPAARPGQGGGGGGGGGGAAPPRARLRFTLPEQISRVDQWLKKQFVGPPATALRDERGDIVSLSAHYASMAGPDHQGGGAGREGEDPPPLWIECEVRNGTQVTVQCNDMELASEVAQDLCKGLKVRELESAADFPDEMEEFKEVLRKVSDHNAVRLRLMADMADASNRVKGLVIQAEDARILGDMALMRRIYADLYTLNRQLVTEYVKRANNHQALLNSLKEVNHMIQKASNLRMGSAKSRVVSECRNAIKVNNIKSLFQIIKEGHDPRGANSTSGGGGGTSGGSSPVPVGGS